ncbi:GNAT family N-acetyltransferase [Vibrio sonorensis]|uniref:GNAT family N-acetyltransferase n=1 Tax=Vibrio sonorensis TaxID=1004316 RepID=UPI0008DAB47D|nr:GNAT family N-acetyltransferase [Vibrio sonorensis]
MDSVNLRAANDKDLEALNQLMFELHDEHHCACPQYFKTAEDIELEKSIARYLNDPQCLVWVAISQNEIVGFITGHFCELISTVSKPVQMGSVDELYVIPPMRKRGIAKALYQKLEQSFFENGAQEIFVEVWHFNQSAKDFYAQTGFVEHIHWLRKRLSGS